MYNSTIVESYFDQPKKHLHAAVELGYTALNTIADLLANQAKPLEPTQCEAIGQLIKEVNMLAFLAYEKTVKH